MWRGDTPLELRQGPSLHLAATSPTWDVRQRTARFSLILAAFPVRSRR